VEIGQPENTCQPTNIVSCFTHQIDDLLWSALKLVGSGPPVRDSFLGPKCLIGYLPSALSRDWLGLHNPKKKKKIHQVLTTR